MKRTLAAVTFALVASFSHGQATVPPPSITTPAITTWVAVTNVTLVPVVTSNATIRVFTVLFTNQVPVMFMASMTDGSTVAAKATAIPALANPVVLGDFNGLLAQVVASGTRYAAATNRTPFARRK